LSKRLPCPSGGFGVHYWREGQKEVDFVLKKGKIIVGIEVKSGLGDVSRAGMEEFARAFAPERVLLVGGDGIQLEQFLANPAVKWVE
jgi:hypothetical protein